MTHEDAHLQSGDRLIKSRFGESYYIINSNTYYKILETIKFYHESLYLLPDFEKIEAEGADHENKGKRVMLKMNEILFIDRRVHGN